MEVHYETALDAAVKILEKGKETTEAASRARQQQLAEEARQVGMDAERVKNKELMTSRHNGLYQKIDNILQAVSEVLDDPHTVRVERKT